MQGILLTSLIIAAVASRPIEVRLWRAGRLSDRSLAILLLARFPIICVLGGLIQGASIPFLLLLTPFTLIPGALFYRFTLGVVREQRPHSG